MNPIQISAQFAAYTWFLNCNAGRSAAEATDFARHNWASFLHCADKGLGRLLIRLAGPKQKAHERLTRTATRSVRTRTSQRALERVAAG